MQANRVHTLEDEAAWEHAKDLAASEYPDATGSNYWHVVMRLYAKMTDYVAKSAHVDHDPTWRMAR
jgi:hypothetical protein